MQSARRPARPRGLAPESTPIGLLLGGLGLGLPRGASSDGGLHLLAVLHTVVSWPNFPSGDQLSRPRHSRGHLLVLVQAGASTTPVSTPIDTDLAKG